MAGQDTEPTFHMHYGDSLDDKNFELHGRGILLLLTLLCILLFFTLLYLYFRWACSNYPATTSTSASASPITANTTNVSVIRSDNESLGLSAEIINNISVRLYEGSEENRECAICLGGLVKGQKVKLLPSCSHIFHPDCVDTWLKTRSSCPLCRGCVVQKNIIEMKDVL